MPLHPQARLQHGTPIAIILNAAFTMGVAVGHAQGSASHG